MISFISKCVFDLDLERNQLNIYKIQVINQLLHDYYNTSKKNSKKLTLILSNNTDISNLLIFSIKSFKSKIDLLSNSNVTLIQDIPENNLKCLTSYFIIKNDINRIKQSINIFFDFGLSLEKVKDAL